MKAKHFPALLDDGAESFQTALDQLSSAHSLEVGALRRENSSLKVQVGQLQSSLHKLQFIGSNEKPIAFAAGEADPKPGLAFVTNEACEAVAAWPIQSPVGDEDDWAGLGSVAEDPEPDVPRQMPQVHSSKFHDNPQPVVHVSNRVSEREVRKLEVDEALLPGEEQAHHAENTGRRDPTIRTTLRAEDASKEVADLVKDIQKSTRVALPSVRSVVSLANVNGRGSGRRNHRTAYGEGEEQGAIQRCMSTLVENNYFDFVCGAMIILNSVLIGWNVEYKTIYYDQDLPTIEILGHVCSLFFLVELLMRLVSQGKFYFHADNRPWNYFDIILVVYSIIDFLLLFILAEKNSAGFHSNMKTIKMFRILRVFRVFRFFRELSLLALMIVDSIRSLVWALIMLTVIIYVFAICFTQSASEYIQIHGDDGDPGVQRWFGGLFRTVYSLVLAMLGGVSWHEVSDPLLLVHWSQAALFFFYITFTILAVLNIITGVFVDNAVETAQTQREFLVQKEMEIKEKYVKEMRDFFMDMDQDGSGTVTLEEVKEYFDDLRVQSYFQALGIDPADTERLFQLIDDDGSGEISVDEFLDGCLRLKGSARSIDVHQLMYECKRLGNRQDELLRLMCGDTSVATARIQGKKKRNESDAHHQVGELPSLTSLPFASNCIRNAAEEAVDRPGRHATCVSSRTSRASAGAGPGATRSYGSLSAFFFDSECLKTEAKSATGVVMDAKQDCNPTGINPADIVALNAAPDRQAAHVYSASTAAGQGASQTNSPPDSSGARSSPGHFTESMEISYEEELPLDEDIMSW